MARVALAEFPVEPRRVQFVALDTNAVYRVFTATETYALRLARPGWRAADDLRLAAAWQTALADETDIAVPRPIVAHRYGQACPSLHHTTASRPIAETPS